MTDLGRTPDWRRGYMTAKERAEKAEDKLDQLKDQLEGCEECLEVAAARADEAEAERDLYRAALAYFAQCCLAERGLEKMEIAMIFARHGLDPSDFDE